MQAFKQIARSSQFPFWDFFECNLVTSVISHDFAVGTSQFPFWDFFECNTCLKSVLDELRVNTGSQFPFWDFFECNMDVVSLYPTALLDSLNSLFGISLNATYLPWEPLLLTLRRPLNSLFGISLNATNRYCFKPWVAV